MIDEEATFEKFGYHSTDWEPKSRKKIVVACDDCGKLRIIRRRDYHARCNSCAHKGKHHSEEARKKNSDAHKGKHHSEETRKRMSDAHKGEKNSMFGKKGKNAANWQGGKSYAPYCLKFNDEFKEKIRDKFDRLCFLCGKTEEENGKKLSVHHVNYNKNCGCDGDKTCQFVPLCIGCNSKVNYKRDMWEAKIKAMMRNKLSGWVI